jgi:hypothetical protein
MADEDHCKYDLWNADSSFEIQEYMWKVAEKECLWSSGFWC